MSGAKTNHQASGTLSQLASAPEVSIIVTVYNCCLYLKEAIESVLAQRTSATWELLLVDDGSSDGSSEIARSLAAHNPGRIVVLYHPEHENRGISASRNLALRHARAPILAFLDADDVWVEDRLERHLPLFRAHPEAAMLYAQAERWYDFDRPICSVEDPGRNFVPPLIPPGEPGGLLAPPQLLQWFLEDESMTPCTCTVLVRTEAARRVGGFERRFKGMYDDQVFYAKLALQYKIFVSLDCVARYRQHKGSCCAVALETSTGEEDRERFLSWLQTYLRPPAHSPFDTDPRTTTDPPAQTIADSRSLVLT